jgi:hypothetical protein
MRTARPAFTLFELILAIALSATLLVLIGSAINLYLLQVDASRTRVEEAQLARSILSMIAADIRATTLYQTQDISAIEQLAANAASFDVDEIDQAGTFTGGATTASGATSGTAGSTDGTQLGVNDSSTTLAPGLNGTLEELILDVTRLPRLDELYPAVAAQPGAAGMAAAAAPRPSDLKTVRYLMRQGSVVEASDVATTSLVGDAQLQIGGLVRQTLDRAARDMAEQSSNSALLDTGQVLVAPEVVRVEFRYFDGTVATEGWDMRELQALPQAVEVRIWLGDSNSATLSTANYGATAGALNGTRMYSQTVYLPMADSSSAGSGSTATDAGGETSSSAASGTATGTGSGGFGSQTP